MIKFIYNALNPHTVLYGAHHTRTYTHTHAHIHTNKQTRAKQWHTNINVHAITHKMTQFIFNKS